MTDEEKALIEAAAKGATIGLAQKIPPIYSDLLQPTVKQVGKAMGTIAGLINIAIASVVSSFIWNYEETAFWLHADLAEKLKNVKEDDIIVPKVSVVGPAIESIKFLADEPNLRELFSTLIATSLNRNTAHKAHPGFVEIIKNLSANEAVILSKYAAGESIPFIRSMYEIHEDEKIRAYKSYFFDFAKCEILLADITNLQRLGLIFQDDELALVQRNVYRDIRDSVDYLEFLANERPKAFEYSEREFFYSYSPMGVQFCDACISN